MSGPDLSDEASFEAVSLTVLSVMASPGFGELAVMPKKAYSALKWLTSNLYTVTMSAGIMMSGSGQ